MNYFKTDFKVRDSCDKQAILYSLLLHNDIFTKPNFNSIADFENMFIQNGWLPKDFDFNELYFEKNSTIYMS